jgi:UDP-N-acetylglucosamine/UDP-N-acetyl-alpha-D-glucosaminouronate 4-epimerase
VSSRSPAEPSVPWRVLVTGGAGFIGSHLVDALLAAGHEVRVLDNFATGDRRNLAHVRGDVEIVEGDIRSYERAHVAVRGCEIVFHQAALPSVPRSIQDPLTSNEVNVGGTLNVLLAARDAGVQRVVYASSSSVYGATPGDVKREDMPVAPLSPYGVAKYAGEAYCSSFHGTYGIETVALRYFNVFGPRQSPISEYSAVIPAFMAALLMGDAATIYGDGLQSRDFTYVGNVVDANLRAAFTPAAAGHVFNVACGNSHTLLGVLEETSIVAAREATVVHEPARVGEVRMSRADVAKARELLGYRPVIDLREGLARTYEHLSRDESLIPRIMERQRWLAVAAT